MLRDYAAERLRPLPLLAATVLLSGAATFLGEGRGGVRFVVDAALALSLVVHFRIWDDIEDRTRDAIRYPARVTVIASSVLPLADVAAAIALISAAALVVRDGLGTSLATLVAAWALFAVWYRHRGVRTAWSDHVLLAKYPALVVIVAGDRFVATAATVWTLAFVYLVFCVYEALHDDTAPWRRLRIAVEVPLLGSTAVALGLSLGGVS